MVKDECAVVSLALNDSVFKDLLWLLHAATAVMHTAAAMPPSTLIIVDFMVQR
jgi:hypothetical protein